MPLDEFVGWLDTGGVDPHWRPQADFVLDAEGRLAVDHLASVEQFAAGMQAIEARIGPLGTVQRRGRQTADAAGAEALFSDKSQDGIRRLYARDFELLAHTAKKP